MRRASNPVPLHTAKRSEEHTSELQSQSNLVCRLLLEKKNKLPTLPSLNLRTAASVSITPYHHTPSSPFLLLSFPPYHAFFGYVVVRNAIYMPRLHLSI